MLKLFSGTANPKLSEDVASSLGLQLSDLEVVRFDNSEVRVMVNEDVKDINCAVIQPFSNPTDTNLIEFFLTCDALRREEARKVIGIVPYFGYARQNIQHRPGECISANVFIRIMESIGFHKIYTVDLHDKGTKGVFTIPFRDISGLPLIGREIQRYFGDEDPSPKKYAIVSPDQGGIERARQFGVSFFGSDDFDLAVTEKKRDKNMTHKSKAVDLYGDVADRICIIVDDIATSAGTLIHSASLCQKNGAKSVVAAVTHHDFSSAAVKKITESPLEMFFTTNSIALPEKFQFPKLKEISIADLIAEELEYLM